MWTAARKLIGLWLVVCLGAACYDGTGPRPGDEPIRTDALSYRLQPTPSGFEAKATAVYVNHGSEAVHFMRCLPTARGPVFFIQREAPDTTRSAVGEVWACGGGIPTGRLAPGDSLVVDVSLGSLDSPNAMPPILMAHRTGRFRVYFNLCAGPAPDSDVCDLSAPEDRRSNTFELLPP